MGRRSRVIELDRETAEEAEILREYGMDVKMIASLTGEKEADISTHLRSRGEALGRGAPLSRKEIARIRNARDAGLKIGETAYLLGRSSSIVQRHWLREPADGRYIRWARRMLERPITP